MKQTAEQPFTRYQLIIGWMNFVLAVPGIYLLLGLPLIMREYGWSGTDIGLFQLAGLPAIFKLLLALPIQRLRTEKRHYSNWLLLLILLLVALLYLISQPAMLSRRLPLFLLALTISLLSTWADIPLNALTVKLLPRSEQMRAGSIRAMALFSGAIVGGGFMLVLQGLWGWQAPFYMMSAGLLLGLLLMGWVKEDQHQEESSTQASEQPLIDLAGFFRQPGAKLWLVLLIICFPFIAAAWLYLKPMLLDLGLPAQNVAWLVGVGGGSVGVVFSLLSQRLIHYLGIARAIPAYLFWALLSLSALTLSVSFTLNISWVIAGMFLVAISMGLISSLMFGLMMLFTRHQYRASDYGLQATIFVITRLSFPIAAGALLDIGGYSVMLTALWVGILLAFLFALLVARPIQSMVDYTSQLSQKEG